MIDNRLKHILVDKNMSLRQLSQNTGITYSMVYDFANKRRGSVQFSVLDAICEELNIQPGDMLKWVVTDITRDAT